MGALESRRPIATLLLLCASIGIAVVGAEWAARLALNPVDFLRPELICDPRYGHRIRPESGGHDAWGFRNPAVPNRADILAVGDSQTYGESATAQHSWPAWLGALTGRTVYNAGVGAYGPVEYEKLVADLTPKLRPRLVVIGVYTGNDIWDASESCPNYRPDLRTVGSCQTPTQLLCRRVMDLNNHEGRRWWLRDWLSKHSVLYQLVKFSSSRFTDRARLEAHPQGSIIVTVNGHAVGFDIPFWMRMTDIDDPKVYQGIAITLQSISDIKRHCDDAGVECLFALIPTKESVYSPLVAEKMPAADGQRLARIVDHEQTIRARLLTHLQAIQMSHVDVLPMLREAARASERRLYPTHDPHPNGDGYRVIAAAIAASLEPH